MGTPTIRCAPDQIDPTEKRALDPKKTKRCGTQDGQAWTELVICAPTRDHSNVIAARDLRKAARTGNWEKKKSKRGKRG